jgi:hypothetical protein
MAEQNAVPVDGHPDMDYAEHEKTYKLFLGLVKYCTIGAILILTILALLTL